MYPDYLKLFFSPHFWKIFNFIQPLRVRQLVNRAKQEVKVPSPKGSVCVCVLCVYDLGAIVSSWLQMKLCSALVFY